MSFQQQSGPFWNFVAELNEQGPSHPWFTQRRANRFGDKAGGNGQEQPNAFWDFVAELNEQGRAHPWFAQRRANRRGENADANAQEQTNPWVGTMPFRGWRGNGRGHGHHGLRAQAVGQGAAMPESTSETETAVNTEPGLERDSTKYADILQSGHEGHRGPGARRGWGMGGRGRGGHGCGRGRGGMGGPRARAAEAGPSEMPVQSMGENARRAPGVGRGGRGGGRGRGAAFGRTRGEAVATNSGEEETAGPGESKFRPVVDVFDHPEAYIVHVNLPGAKKKDVEVNWEAEHSRLHITGTVARPVDAEVLETLVTHERKAGAFQRRVRLGNGTSPAQVDVDGITAKIEDGILRIEVPKLESGFVEIKKVDIA